MADWADRPNFFFNILEELLLVQKQTIAQKKALILGFFEPQVLEGRGNIKKYFQQKLYLGFAFWPQRIRDLAIMRP